MYPTCPGFWLVQWHKHFFTNFLGADLGQLAGAHQATLLPSSSVEPGGENKLKKNALRWRQRGHLPIIATGITDSPWKINTVFFPVKTSKLINQTKKTPSQAWLHSFLPGSSACLAGVQVLISSHRGHPAALSAKPSPCTHRTPAHTWEWVLALTLECASSLQIIYVILH